MALLSFCSCKKFLDKVPQSASTDASSWKTEDDANSAVAACYSLTRDALNNGFAHYSYGDLPTDEFGTEIAGGDGRYKDVMIGNWNLSVPAANFWDPMQKLRRYDLFYKVIDQANRCIKNISLVPLTAYSSSNPELRQKELIGEAYFTRAFAYFYMARIWSDVPLVLESAEDISQAPKYKRNTQAEVLTQCLADLEIAKANLDWYSGAAVRAGKGAVFALQAHIYAWQGDYTKCTASADAVISSGVYQYADRSDYLSIFKGQSSEGIFEIAQNAVGEGGGQYNNNISFYTLRSPYLATNNNNSWLPLNGFFTFGNLFSDTMDLRYKQAFAFQTSSDPICIKYSNITYMTAGQTNPVAFNNIIVFRLSDIALLKAEALTQTGDAGGARNIVNEIRAMANLEPITATDEELLQAIFDERGRELFLEGHRYYDLVRFGRITNSSHFDSKMSDNDFLAGRYYWPLDPSLILTNTLLTQTPFWKSRM